MPRPLDVSVIVATYNQAFTTGLALQALFAQRTDCSYEVIVCDDGSRPENVGILLQLMADAPIPSRLVWQQDRGFRLSASRNNAIGFAQGRILIFLDGDLVPEEDFVDSHLMAHGDDKTIAVGQRRWRNPEAVEGRNWQIDELWTVLRSPEAFDGKSRVVEAVSRLGLNWSYKSRPWDSIQGCNVSFTNSHLIRFDEQMVGWGFEDIDLAYGLIVVHGYRLSHIDAAAYDVQGYVARAQTWKQSDYIAHFLNGFRFLEKWAHTGMTAQNAIPKHTLNPETGLWTMTPFRKRINADPVDDRFIRTWLTERGYSVPGGDNFSSTQ